MKVVILAGGKGTRLAPYTTILRAMHIHPTVTELIPTVLGSLQPLA